MITPRAFTEDERAVWRERAGKALQCMQPRHRRARARDAPTVEALVDAADDAQCVVSAGTDEVEYELRAFAVPEDRHDAMPAGYLPLIGFQLYRMMRGMPSPDAGQEAEDGVYRPPEWHLAVTLDEHWSAGYLPHSPAATCRYALAYLLLCWDGGSGDDARHAVWRPYGLFASHVDKPVLPRK